MRSHKYQNSSSDAIWLDLILRYCNAGYEELIAEELRKANQFYYTIREENNYFRIQPFYELVRLYAFAPADRAHIMREKTFQDGYSVLTTGSDVFRERIPQYYSPHSPVLRRIL